MPRKNSKKYVLVYQGGIANVFQVDCFNLANYGRNAKRVLQHAFSPCEYYCKGLLQAGCKVAVLACNQLGDIRESKWSDNLEEQPFSDKFNFKGNVK